MNVPKKYLYFALLLILEFFTSYYFLNNGQYSWTSAPLDDSWIHYVYAKNVAGYGLFYYNVGELETGSTSPLWVVILAIPELLGINVLLASKVLGIILSFITSIIIFLTVRKLTKNNHIAIIPAILTILNPYMIYWKVSGMEVTLFAFLTILSLYFFVQKKHKRAGITIGLAILSRPEAYIVLGTLFLLSIFDKKRIVLKKKMTSLLLIALLVSMPWNLYCLYVTGKPLSNTFYVKTRQGFNLMSSAQSLNYMTHTVHTGLSILNTDLSILLDLSVLVLVTWTIIELYRKKKITELKLFLLPIITIIIMTLIVDYNFLGRYYAPLLAPLYLGFSLTLATKNKYLKYYTTGVFALFIIAFLLNMQLFSNLYALSCMNIYDVQESMALYIRNNIPPEANISTPDAGAIKYLISNNVYDVVGLNTHQGVDWNIIDYRLEWTNNINPSEGLELVHQTSTNPNIVCAHSTLGLYKI